MQQKRIDKIKRIESFNLLAKTQCPFVRPHQPNLNFWQSKYVPISSRWSWGGHVSCPLKNHRPGNALQQGVILNRSHSTTSSSGSNGTRLPHLKSGLQQWTRRFGGCTRYTTSYWKDAISGTAKNKEEVWPKHTKTMLSAMLAWSAWRSLWPDQAHRFGSDAPLLSLAWKLQALGYPSAEKWGHRRCNCTVTRGWNGNSLVGTEITPEGHRK